MYHKVIVSSKCTTPNSKAFMVRMIVEIALTTLTTKMVKLKLLVTTAMALQNGELWIIMAPLTV